MRDSHPPFALRVLVVEDDPDSAQTLALLLRLWGYEVAIANDGPDALDAAPTFQPDVVFLDIALPGMDGCEVARQLRHLPGMAEVLVAAITGYGHEADVRRCKGAGIDCHFLKPVEPAALRELLAKAEPPSERNKSPDGATMRSISNERAARAIREANEVRCRVHFDNEDFEVNVNKDEMADFIRNYRDEIRADELNQEVVYVLWSDE